MQATTPRLPTSGKVFLVCEPWLVALGVYFMLLRPTLLPEVPRYIDLSLEALRSAASGLERWLGHVFNGMGGFMIAAGVMTALVAWRLAAGRERGTLVALAVAGAIGVATISATNFLLQSDFRWLLLASVALSLFGLVCYWFESRVNAL